MLYGFPFPHTQMAHQVANTVRGENTHQIVFQRQIETGKARVALATGAATQLVVDTTGFVALGANDVQAARLDDLVMAFQPFGFDISHLLRRRVV